MTSVKGELLDKPKTIPTQDELRELYAIDEATKPRLDELARECVIPGELSVKENYQAVAAGIRKCVKIRSAIEARRKELKQDSLEYGRRVDAVAKMLTAEVERIEGPLAAAKAKQDQTVEEARLAREAEERRIAEEAERKRREEEQAKLRAEQARLAEERRAFEAEQARVRAEQAAEMAKIREAQEAERRKIEAEQAAARAEQERERQRLEAERREIAAERERHEARLRAEREAAERAERERIEAEEAARLAAERESRRVAALPDIEKLRGWAAGVKKAMSAPCKLADEQLRQSARRTNGEIGLALASLTAELDAIAKGGE